MESLIRAISLRPSKEVMSVSDEEHVSERNGMSGLVASNPYRAPDVASDQGRRWRRTSRFWTLVLFVSPLFWIVGCYATWLMAWLELGHRPRISIDDPKSIGPLTGILWMCSAVLSLASPVTSLAVLAAMLSGVFPPCGERTASGLRRLYWSGAFLLFIAITIALAQADPGRVLEWWID